MCNRFESNQKRSLDIDILKSVAIWGVIIIHVCTAGGYDHNINSVNWLSTLFWGSITRSSVPIFLMCSGVLMLEPSKKLTIKRLYLHNILRLIFSMIIWGMLYKIYDLVSAHELTFLNLLHCFQEIFLFRQIFHFYYIHVILLVYAMLPITRCFVANATKQQLEYALVLWIILGIICPTLNPYKPMNLITGIPKQWMLNMSYAAIGYGILGYYLKRYSFKKDIYILSGVVGLSIIFFGTWIKSAQNGSVDTTFFEGMSIGVCSLAVSIFGICMTLSNKINACACAIIQWLSKASFCIYLIHIFSCVSSKACLVP